MKVAFDVKGTLDGFHEDRVLKLLKWFQSKGAEITVWSNSYGYAADKAKELNHQALLENGNQPTRLIPAQTKQTKWDLDCAVDPESYYFDFAVEDDTSQTYLAAHKFIWVKDIPDDEALFENLLR